MRMRRKKHLDQRLSESRMLLDVDYGDINPTISVKQKQYIDLKSVFGNENPLWIEIGCGKGKFAIELAKANPNINIIAIEKTDNVIVTAAENAEAEVIKNLRFIKMGAEYLQKFFRDKSIDRIFLNFSCPYPKSSYKNRRLTHRNFLNIYKSLLCDGAEIHQKTDNQHFFEFSIEQYSQNGFKLKSVTFDLHKSNFVGNIMTEYEKKFSDMGQNIYRLEAFL